MQSIQTTNPQQQYLDPYNQVVYVQANGTQTATQPMNGTSAISSNKVPPLRPTAAYSAVSPVVGYQNGYQTMPHLNGQQVQLVPQVRQHMSAVPLQTQLGLQQVLQSQYQTQYQPQTVANLHALQQQQLAMQQYMNQQQQLIQPQNQFSSFPPNQNQYPQYQGQRFQVASYPQQAQHQHLPNTQKFQPEAISPQTTNHSESAKNDSAPPATPTAATAVSFSPQTQPNTVSNVSSPQLLPQMIPTQGNNPQMVLQSSFLHPSILPNHTFLNSNPQNQLFPSAANTIPQSQTVFQNGNPSFFVNPSQPQNQQMYVDSNQASNLQSSSGSVKPEAKRTRFAPY